MQNVMRPLPHQQQGLIDLLNFSNLNNAKILEIGSYAGDSTRFFFESNRFKEIHCLDAWEAGYDSLDYASNNMLGVEESFLKFALNKSNIFIHKAYSSKITEIFKNGYFDIVYIDACHTYDAVVSDIKMSIPKIKKGGFIAGHDYLDPNFKVTQAVHDTLGFPHQIFQDSSWIFSIEKIKSNIHHQQ